MIDSQITIQMVRALSAQYDGERQAALAELMIFARNPVAVGDHPNVLSTIDGLITRVATAQGKLDTLNSYFSIEAIPGVEGEEG
jgi:hypothetical protein